MSRMLTLLDAAWSSIQFAAAQDRPRDTLEQLNRFLKRQDLPSLRAAEAHQLAGELHLASERYGTARRHLNAAAKLGPGQATTYFLWALAYERDPNGCDRRAFLLIRRAYRLEPGNRIYRCHYGRAAIRTGQMRIGIRAILGSVETNPGDLTVLRIAILGLIEAGRLRTARRLLTQARFLCPGSFDLVPLWGQLRFAMAHREQRGTTRHRQDAEFAKDGGRVILPFLRAVGTETLEHELIQDAHQIRHDVYSISKPHFPRLSVQKADR